MGGLNGYPLKKVEKSQDNEENYVYYENKKRYHYYYTCIPLHELINKIDSMFKKKKIEKYDNI